MTQDINALITQLKKLPLEWRAHANGNYSVLYRAGIEHCALELDAVLKGLTDALDEGARNRAGEPPAPEHPFIKCLRCGLKSYHPKDREERYCGRCHVFHQRIDEYQLG